MAKSIDVNVKGLEGFRRRQRKGVVSQSTSCFADSLVLRKAFLPTRCNDGSQGRGAIKIDNPARMPARKVGRMAIAVITYQLNFYFFFAISDDLKVLAPA